MTCFFFFFLRKFAKVLYWETKVPFHESLHRSTTLLSASQIVYPACTVPSTRWILYYRLEYLMRPVTLGTRGKKFEVPPLPRDISHQLPNSFRLDFRDRRGTNFFTRIHRDTRYTIFLLSSIACHQLRVNARSRTPGESRNSMNYWMAS